MPSESRNLKEGHTSQGPAQERWFEESIENLDKLRHANGHHKTADVRVKMQRVMQNNAAVFRTGETLKEGVKLIDEVLQMSKDLHTSDRSLVW